MKKAIFFMMAAMVLTSCTIRFNGGEDSKSGKTATKDFNLQDFNEIALLGNGTVEFTQDSIFSVTLEADERVADQIEVYKEGAILCIGQKDYNKDKNNKKIVLGNKVHDYKVKVTAPTLDKASVAGSGSFSSDGILTEMMSLEISGPGTINIADLETKQVNASIAGSGVVNVKEKNTDITVLTIAGSGTMGFNFKDCGNIKASIAGSGVVNLSGNAESLEQEVAGSGVINQTELKVK